MRDQRDPGTLDLHTGALFLGYARGGDAAVARERAALLGAGCSLTLSDTDKASTVRPPALLQLLSRLRRGDVVVVTSLDQLAGNLELLLFVGRHLRQVGAGVRSLSESWADTTCGDGASFLTMLGGLERLERRALRRHAELAAQPGRRGPKPRLTDNQVSRAKRLIAAQRATVEELADEYGVHRSTLWRNLQDAE